MTDPHTIAARLSTLDRERLTAWTGPMGAAYNAVSEDLCEMGLLDRHWRITPLGSAVRSILGESNG